MLLMKFEKNSNSNLKWGHATLCLNPRGNAFVQQVAGLQYFIEVFHEKPKSKSIQQVV